MAPDKPSNNPETKPSGKPAPEKVTSPEKKELTDLEKAEKKFSEAKLELEKFLKDEKTFDIKKIDYEVKYLTKCLEINNKFSKDEINLLKGKLLRYNDIENDKPIVKYKYIYKKINKTTLVDSISTEPGEPDIRLYFILTDKPYPHFKGVIETKAEKQEEEKLQDKKPDEEVPNKKEDSIY